MVGLLLGMGAKFRNKQTGRFWRRWNAACSLLPDEREVELKDLFMQVVMSRHMSFARFLILKGEDGRRALDYFLGCGDKATVKLLVWMGVKFKTEHARGLWIRWNASNPLHSDKREVELKEMLSNAAELYDLPLT